MSNNVEYSGFATPSLILDKSDKEDRGSIIDKYAKIEEQDGLICGQWSRGFEDGLIHIYLVKPVAAFCDERKEWVAKQTLLKEHIDYAPPVGAEMVSSETRRKAIPTPKKRLVLDPETKQFRMI